MKLFFYSALCTACLLAGCKEERISRMADNITVREGNVYYTLKGLDKPFNVLFLSDTHFTVEDERGKDFYLNTRRMGGNAVELENYGIGNGRNLAFKASLDKAQKAGSELVILGGDIINFPSLASVESIKRLLDESGLNWIYTAGNHDWHYEGEQGKSSVLKEKWIHLNLKTLYQETNPMFHAQTLHNINFVTIDNSDFEISKEQLEFFRQEIKKGLPIILSMHIPLYLPGHTIDYGCGNPAWNRNNDIYYEIERREPWPEKGFGETTFEFRNLALNSPEVIGIFAGHTHEEAMDFHNNKLQYVADANYNYKDVLIHFIPAD